MRAGCYLLNYMSWYRVYPQRRLLLSRQDYLLSGPKLRQR